jgi:hypothetical protein
LSRGSSVGIATGYRLEEEESEFESLYGQERFALHFVNTGSGVHPTSYTMPGLEAGRSSPSVVVVKKT